MMQKVEVNGGNAFEAFNYLRSTNDGADIKWNFQKFLVDKDGKVVKGFAHSFHPDGIVPDIEKLLA